MNKMFKLIELELHQQGKTKVWFAGQLNESTQNINNWKVRGVPAAKVKGIADVLGVSREYLEGESSIATQSVASTRGDYRVEAAPASNKRRYRVHVEPNDQGVEGLLSEHLHKEADTHYVDCLAWRHVDPFLEIELCTGDPELPERVYLPLDRIVGISDYHEHQDPDAKG